MPIHLTDKAVDALTPIGDQATYWDTKLRGFGVQVTASVKTFVVVCGFDGRTVAIGRWPGISVDRARGRARDRQREARIADRGLPLPWVRRTYFDSCALTKPPISPMQTFALLRGPDKPISAVTRRDLELGDPDAAIAWDRFFGWCVERYLIDQNPLA